MIRVEVTEHFNEDAFSHGLVHGIADRLRAELVDMECPDHHGPSTVRVSTEGVAQTVNDISIQMEGCCDEVVRRVNEVVAELRGGGDGAPTG